MSLKETSTTMLDMILYRIGLVRRSVYEYNVDLLQRTQTHLINAYKRKDTTDVNKLYDEYAKGE